MAEPVTIARPYAEAVFSLAKERGELQKWSAMLGLIAGIYHDEQVQKAIANPNATNNDIENLMLAVCGERIDGAARNFIQTLVHNRRLPVVAEVRELYEQLRAEDEGMAEAKISSAFPLENAQLEQLVALLSSHYRKKINPSVSVDSDLIGGIKVQVGDKVWDASVRGRLQDMAAALMK
jgi:F-type H+-transporting ATPase subunit delta